MVNRSLKKGAYLLLFPEDISLSEASPFYVVVKSARKNKTIVTKLADDGPSGTDLSLPPSTALNRVVPSQEALGPRPGAWPRKAVCVPLDGSYRYGQVVDYADGTVVVQTKTERLSVAVASITTEVYPVIAMAMQLRDWPTQEWSESTIQDIHDSLIDKLLGTEPLDGGSAWISVGQWVQAASPHFSAVPAPTFSWIEPDTVISYSVSLGHVVNYVYYVTSLGRVPPAIRRRLGHTFCDDPVNEAVVTGQDTPVSETSVPRQAPRHRSAPSRSSGPSLFEPDIRDDEEEKAQDEHDVASAMSAPVPRPRRTPVPHRSAEALARNSVEWRPFALAPVPEISAAATDSDAELDFLDPLRRSRPHLVARYLERGAGATKRARDESSVALPVTYKRGRYEFAPSPQQELVHGLITGTAHQGTSGFSFVEFLMAYAKFRFRVYPGVLVRVYDFQFGARGLSVLFKPLGYKEGLLSQLDATVSMTDFSTSAKILAPPQVTSWTDLSSSCAGLVQYCVLCCDETTQDLVRALQSFVGEAEQWQLWGAKELPLLTLWINSILAKYRAAVIADGYAGSDTRLAVSAEFSVFNPQLQALLASVLADRIAGDEQSTSKSMSSAVSVGSRVEDRAVKVEHRAARPERRVPAAVLSVLLRQQGKELCLRHLSKRGCQSSDAVRCVNPKRYHSRPPTLPPPVVAHVKAQFGGLCEQYQTI